MKRDKCITVMAILDDDTQAFLRNIQKDFERLYGLDTKTKDIPFHITLYRHSEPSEIKVPVEIIRKMEKVTQASIVGIELGEFFPMKKISRVLFD